MSGPAASTHGGVTPQRDAVVTHIRRAIVLGTMQPGDKLREVRLAAALNVSRPTLREALNVLVQDGLLVHEPYRGYGVTRLDAGAVLDLARTRVPLDLIAIDAILSDDTGERLNLVRAAWTQYDQHAGHNDPLVQHQAHIAFHRGLWEASQNTALLRLWPTIEAVTTIALAQDQAARRDPARANTLHHQLVTAILSRNRANIQHELTQHTLSSAEELLTLDQN